jgi:hypothetical protein
MKRVRSPHAKDGWYEVTPAEAMEILRVQDMNRPLREFWAQEIATDVKLKEFAPNGETLVFDERGKLLDGQHRLRACIIANTPIETYCVFGVPKKFFDKFDQGKIRGGSDVLAIFGQKYAALSSAVTKMAIRYDEGSPTNTVRIPNWQVLDFIKKNGKEIAESVGEIHAYVVTGRKAAVLPPTVAAFVYYRARQQDAKRAMEFIEKLTTGEDLKKGTPIYLLRERLLSLQGKKHVLNTYDKLALAIKAWNLFRAQKSTKVLKWVKGHGSSGEAFPRFESSAEAA